MVNQGPYILSEMRPRIKCGEIEQWTCGRKIDNIGNLRFEEGQGEKPIRPRSVSAPQPANTVDYQKVNLFYQILRMKDCMQMW